jgi:tRNA U38,U39,U40 pseudouridine synthase TruA
MSQFGTFNLPSGLRNVLFDSTLSQFKLQFFGQHFGCNALCYYLSLAIRGIKFVNNKYIWCLGIQKVTKRFDSKNAANARTYMYLMPTFAFAPLEKVSNIANSSPYVYFANFVQ